MITENLSTLKIHKLTQAQYNRELEAGNIDENALYLTPDEASDLGIYATKEELDTKADSIHDHDSLYYKEYEIDEMLSYKADNAHNHGISDVTNLQSSLDSKASQIYVNEQINAVTESLETHTDNSDIHVTSENKAQLDEAHSHATSDHAPSDAEKNTIVGIKRNGEDLTIDADRKVNITVPTTASDIGAASSTHDHNDQYDSKGSAGTVQDALDAHTSNSDIHFTATERTKLSGIEEGAQKNTVTGIKGNSESSYRTGNVNITKSNIGLSNVDNTSDTNKPVSTAQKAAIDGALAEAKTYVDGKIDAVMGEGASTTLDTIGEISAAIEAHQDVTDALNAAIGNKVDKVSGKGLSTNDYTTAEKTKLDSIAEGAEVNQNAFGKVTVGSSTISADSKTDTLTFASSDGITLSADTSADKVTITNSGVRSIGTGSSNGTISVNTGGSTANVAVKGLGSAAYTASTAYAAASHGNHVPATETANNAKFLRNDNTWATVTPANIGAAASSHGTHVSYSTTAPVMDGTASVGSASTVARSDHKHPTDTSRASKTEFDEHAVDSTKHITSTERTSWNTAKTHADSSHAPSNAEKNQNAFSNIAVSGQTTVAADTTTDTVTFVGSNVTITTDSTNDKVTFSVADGNTSAKGIVQLTNSTSSTSTTTAATPSSVKSAYDLANTAKTNAATAQSKADSAYSLAEGKVDSLSDLGITATATELNYVDGVTSGIQAQLDGKAASSHGTHVSYGTSASALGTSSAGSASTVSRSDHVHALPALTSCTGTLSVAKGGTGATTAAGAITNLGAMDLSSAQTVSGVKTFSNGIKLGKATMQYDSSAGAIVFTFE